MKKHKEGKGDLACLTLNLLSNSSRFTIHAGLFLSNIQINSCGCAGALRAQFEMMSSFRHTVQDPAD